MLNRESNVFPGILGRTCDRPCEPACRRTRVEDKQVELPGRWDTDKIHIGIEWLESVAFGHVDKIEDKVLIIGVGNTAMDCCRTSKRLGASDVKVIARRPRKFFKASPWELDDAEE